jgi:CTP:molybdopterin cytidylyltransferase MocA
MIKGVEFTAPPSHLLKDVQASIAQALKDLPPEKTGAVVLIATTAGINAAVVTRIGDHFATRSWVGKRWGEPLSGGADVMVSW